jgi:uncharacterized protein
MKPLTISVQSARRLMIAATGFGGAFDDIDSALEHMGFVQIDPINVCGRMVDHILRHRVAGYRELDLMRHLYLREERRAFEHHLPGSQNLAALPAEAWPHLQSAMHERSRSDSIWSGKLTAAEKRLAAQILHRMRDEGPLCSTDVESTRKTKQHEWDSTTLAKSTLQKLFFHGRVLIARRDANRRYYDLPERVLPSAVLASETPAADVTARWLARLKLRQLRLALLKREEAQLLADEVQAVCVEGSTRPVMHVLRSDLPLLHSATPLSLEPRLIAPLDPIVYDRRVTEHVWSYDYRWEVYTPPQKRVRGYYALPLLHGDQFTGHADVKVDREQKMMTVMSRAGRGARAALVDLAKFLEVKLPTRA